MLPDQNLDMNARPTYYYKELWDKSEIIISLEGDYLKVISIGEKSMEFSRRLWENIVDSCYECECFKILGIALTTKANNESDPYDHVSLFEELEINHNFKIAWIEKNPDFKERLHYIETVFYNRGLPGKQFDSEEEAIEWLRS